MTLRVLFTMATARQRHDRSMVVAQAQLIGALFGPHPPDLAEFIARGTLDTPGARPLHHVAGVEEKMREIQQAGGKFVMPEE